MNDPKVQDALQLAKQILDFVVDHLPEDTRHKT